MTEPRRPLAPVAAADLAANYRDSGGFGASLGVGRKQGLLMVDFAR